MQVAHFLTKLLINLDENPWKLKVYSCTQSVSLTSYNLLKDNNYRYLIHFQLLTLKGIINLLLYRYFKFKLNLTNKFKFNHLHEFVFHKKMAKFITDYHLCTQRLQQWMDNQAGWSGTKAGWSGSTGCVWRSGPTRAQRVRDLS